MDRAAKAELVTSLNGVFKDAGAVVVAHYAGMSVAQMTDYRKRMAEAGGKVKVAKNKLAQLALKDTDAAGIVDLFKGQTSLPTRRTRSRRPRLPSSTPRTTRNS